MFFAFTQCGSSAPCKNPRSMFFTPPASGLLAVADFDLCSDLYADEMVFLVTLSAPKPEFARTDFPCTKSFVDVCSFSMRFSVDESWDKSEGCIRVDLSGDVKFFSFDEDSEINGSSVLPNKEANQTQWFVDLLSYIEGMRTEDMLESAID